MPSKPASLADPLLTGVAASAFNSHVLLVWSVFSIVAWAVAAFSLKKIMDSPTFFGTDNPHDLGPVTPTESISLIVYHILRPIFVLLLVPITQAVLKHPCLTFHMRQLWLVTMLVVCMAHICYGAWMARTVLQCGVVFCWLPAFRDGGFFPWDESSPKEAGPVDGMGLRANEGLLTMIFALTLLVAFLVLLVRIRRDAAHSIKVERKARSHSAERARLRRRQICGALVLAVLVIPATFLLTAVMPNNFQKLHLVGGEEGYRLPLVMNSTPPDAEIPGARLRSIYVRVSDGLVLKFWADTMLFYGFLEVLAVMALVSAVIPGFRHALAKRWLGGCSRGEFIMCALFLIMFAMWNYYWAVEKWFGHLNKGADGGKDLNWKFNTGGGVTPSPVNDMSELVARVLGMDSILFMSLLLLPASKSSLWLEALGISWERGVWVHRWLGVGMMVTMAGHALAFWVRWWKLDILFHDLLSTMRYYPLYPGHPNPHHPTDSPGVYGANMTIILMEVIGYPALVIMGLLPLLRRKNYELFKYFHYWFLALIPASIIHAHNGWYFPLGGIAFWLVDAAMRITNSSSPSRLIAAKAHEAESGVTELRFEKSFEDPGMYCWINVPQISLLQWHPFSLSSSPLDGFASMHIKNMGADEFTGKLHNLINKTEGTGVPLTLNVDGPYGPPLELDSRDALLLIAGGIGITVVHSTYRHVMHLARASALPAELKIVRLIFVAKSPDLIHIFADSLQEVLATAVPNVAFSAQVYLTGSDRSATMQFAGFSADVMTGRPDFGSIYDDLLRELTSQASVLVKFCGPESMDVTANAASVPRPRILYESEAFTL